MTIVNFVSPSFHNYPDTLQTGYTTADDFRWICSPCFENFKEMFQFKIGDNNEEKSV